MSTVLVTTAARMFLTAVGLLALTGLAIWLLVWAAHRPSVPKIGPTLVFFTSILPMYVRPPKRRS